MQPVLILSAVVIGVIVGVAIGYLLGRDRTRGKQQSRILETEKLASTAEALAAAAEHTRRQLEAVLAETRQRLEESQRARTAAETELKAERQRLDEERRLLEEAGNKFKDAFDALAAQALKTNNESFLELAKSAFGRFQSDAQKDLESRQKAVETLVQPIHESLNKVDQQIQQMEIARSEAYGGLSAQVKSLISTQERLQSETGNLVKALSAPNVRGRWGEIQLRRVVELAGMVSYCDFQEQATVSTQDGKLRPDMIVRLPGGKNIVVDSKAPLQAYLESLESTDDDRRRSACLAHARQIREHMKNLSFEAYTEQFQPSPRVRCHVSSRRDILQRGAGAGPWVNRRRRNAGRDSRIPHHAHRAAARGRLWMEAGEACRQRAGHQRPGTRTLRTSAYGCWSPQRGG